MKSCVGGSDHYLDVPKMQHRRMDHKVIRKALYRSRRTNQASAKKHVNLVGLTKSKRNHRHVQLLPENKCRIIAAQINISEK